MNNVDIYNAVISGLAGSSQNFTSQTPPADFTRFGDRSVILASAVDALIAPAAITQAEAALMGQVVAGVDFNRSLLGVTPNFPRIAADVVALWTQFRGRIVPSHSNDLIIQVETIADLEALSFNPKAVQVIRYSGLGTEKGGGWFDVDLANTRVPDGGITFANALGTHYNRANISVSVKYAAWYNIFGNNTDVTLKVKNLIATLTNGDEIIWEKGRHIISDVIDIATHGITLKGQGCLDPNPYVDSGTIFKGVMTKIQGVSGTILAVTQNVPDGDTFIVEMSLDPATDLSGFAPGCTIKITNGLFERNNGFFTLMKVDNATKRVMFTSYNQFVHTVSYIWEPSPLDGNNGAFHWEIRKPLFRIHNSTSFFDCFFHGNDTVGDLVQSGAIGSLLVPDTSTPYNACTNNKFERCYFRTAFRGLTIGDYATYASGGGTNVTWTANCDLHKLWDVTFIDCQHSGLCIPSQTGTSVLHELERINISECGLGIAIRRGNFKVKTINFAGNTNADILIQQGSPNSIEILGGHTEGSKRFIVAGGFGYWASISEPIPMLIESFYIDNNIALPADKCFCQFGCTGIIGFKNCIFVGTIADPAWTIGVQGRSTDGVHALFSNAIWFTFEGCSFPVGNQSKIITTLAGNVGLNPVWYHSLSCTTVDPAAPYPKTLIDGVHGAYANPLNTQAPIYGILTTANPAGSITVAAGANTLATPIRSNLTATGAADAVIINGIAAGSDGQVLTLRLKYNQQSTITHLSGAVANGSKIICNTLADIVLAAPGADPAYRVVNLQYEPLEDGGNGAWCVLGYN